MARNGRWLKREQSYESPMEVLRKCSDCKGTKGRENTPDIEALKMGTKGVFLMIRLMI